MWLGILIWLLLLGAEAAEYYQNDYTIEQTRIQVVNCNRSYFTGFNCGLVYFNRTYRALNASARLIKDWGTNVKVQLQVYKFLSNEYRFFPITMDIDACKELERDTFGIIESYQKSANFNIRCPFKKGFYSITYGKIDYSNYPPYMPAGEYKAEAQFTDNSNFLFEIHYYGKIKELKNEWTHLIKALA